MLFPFIINNRDTHSQAALASTLPTVTCVQRPPRAVLTPRRLSSPAMALALIAAGGLCLADHRQNVRGEAVRRRPHGRAWARREPRQARVAQLRPARPGGLAAPTLVRSKSHHARARRRRGKDVNGELVGVRVVDRNELDAGVHQRRR